MLGMGLISLDKTICSEAMQLLEPQKSEQCKLTAKAVTSVTQL